MHTGFSLVVRGACFVEEHGLSSFVAHGLVALQCGIFLGKGKHLCPVLADGFPNHWTTRSPERYVQVLTPVVMNETLFGNRNRAFADIKLSWNHTG